MTFKIIDSTLTYSNYNHPLRLLAPRPNTEETRNLMASVFELMRKSPDNLIITDLDGFSILTIGDPDMEKVDKEVSLDQGMVRVDIENNVVYSQKRCHIVVLIMDIRGHLGISKKAPLMPDDEILVVDNKFRVKRVSVITSDEQGYVRVRRDRKSASASYFWINRRFMVNTANTWNNGGSNDSE